MGVFQTTVNGYTYSFDFVNQVANVDATLNKMSVIDFWTAVKEAQESAVGISYPVIASGGGLDPLTGTTKTFLTIRLYDGWEVNSLKSSGKFEVADGNLIKDNGLDPFLDNPLLTYIQFLSQAGVVVETGVSGLTPTESAKLLSLPTAAQIATAVWDFVVEGTLMAKEFMRLIYSALLGDVTGTQNAQAFKSADGGKTRFDSASAPDGTRTVTNVDGS
jgi:hypothetical protein